MVSLIPVAMEAEIENAMKVFRIPGCQLVIFRGNPDGGEEYVKALGSMDLRGEKAMTTDTRMVIASLTKLFTVHLLLPLLDDNGFTLDTPIREVLSNVDISPMGQWTCRGILTHMTGMPSWDKWFEFEDGGMTPMDLIDKLRVLPARNQPRDKFEYSNVPFSLIDLIITELSGQTFEAHLQESFLRPLGMDNTSPETDGRTSMGHWSKVNTEGSVGMKEVEFAIGRYPAIRSAGGILSNGKDLLKWLKHLSTSSTYRTASEPIVKEGFTSHSYPFEQATYGLCLAQTTYRGMQIIEHVGDYPGFRALISDLPEKQVKFGLLSNGSEVEDSAGFRDWIRLRLFDHFGGFDEIERTTEILKLEKRLIKKLEHIFQPVRGGATPSILGVFECKGLMTLHLTLENAVTERPACTTIPWGSGFFGPKNPLFTFIREDNGVKKYEGCWELTMDRTKEKMYGEPFVAYLDEGKGNLKLIEVPLKGAEGAEVGGGDLTFSRV